MALISLVPALDATTAAARALEAALGHGMMLSVGEPTICEPSATSLPGGETRSVALPFGDGAVGEITLVVTMRFAASIEAVTSDASLLTATLPALREAAAVIQPATQLVAAPEYAGEIATDTLIASVEGDFVIVPIAENDTPVACLVTRIVPLDPAEMISAATVIPASAAAPGDVTDFPPPATPAPLAPPIAVPAASVPAAAGITGYEFPQLSDGNRAPAMMRPITLLNDVRLEVVAELGSRRMKVRDLVALAPGSVIQLDRPAGSPVDVLVNGAMLARAEVVVIDEEFGIRVSEIIVGDT